jgi:transposase
LLNAAKMSAWCLGDSVAVMRFATGADHDGAAQSRPGTVFLFIRLDEAIPNDHPVREVAAVLDLSWVHSELAPYYPRIGRPSNDPVLMIRMLIIG